MTASSPVNTDTWKAIDIFSLKVEAAGASET